MNDGARLPDEQVAEVRASAGTFKVVFLAMIGGVIMFTIIAVAISRPLELELPPSTMSLIFVGLALVSGIQGLFLPRLLRAAAERTATQDGPAPVEQLVANWFSSSLVGIALLETAAFLNVSGLFVDKNPLHLPLVVVWLALMFVHFPSANRILDWVERVRGAANG